LFAKLTDIFPVRSWMKVRWSPLSHVPAAIPGLKYSHHPTGGPYVDPNFRCQISPAHSSLSFHCSRLDRFCGTSSVWVAQRILGQLSSRFATQSEIDALKADVSQMKVVLNQMATNLAAVSDSQSPLKHQFQLDIEMWQIVIMQAQHRIDRMEHDQERDVH
jgi:hypothetical protein